MTFNIPSVFLLFYKTAKYFVIFFSLAWLTFYLYTGYRTRQLCVELPNGLLIGYRAYFNLAENFIWPIPTIKLPDGTVLLEPGYRINGFAFSESAVYGVAHTTNGSEKSWSFIYRPDIGFKKTREGYQLFDKEIKKDLIHHPGLTTAEGRLITTGAWTVYKTLIHDGLYRRDNCPLAIFGYQ